MTAGLSSPEPEDGGAFNEDAPLLPPGAAVERQTPVRRYADASETAGANSGPILKLARVLDPVAYDPTVEAVTVGQLWDRQRRQAVAEAHATAAHTAGYRRLVEDDDTVRTVAESLAGSDGWTIVWPDPGQEFEDPLLRYLRVARAVVRALGEET